MPIREENKARYPADWKAISKRIRDKAGNRCEKCAAKNGEMIFRFNYMGDKSKPVFMDKAGDIFCADTGSNMDWDHAPDVEGPWVKVVLTVAHLDHMPENCDDENLRAWCQRCHNIYDMPMRKAGIKARAKEKLAERDMFSGEHLPHGTPQTGRMED